MFILLVLTVSFLAWSNGANDTFKGVASLYGSGATGYRTALVWGTLSTAAGSAAAILLAAGLLGKFSGKRLMPEAFAARPEFLVSVARTAGPLWAITPRRSIPATIHLTIVNWIVAAGFACLGGGSGL